MKKYILIALLTSNLFVSAQTNTMNINRADCDGIQTNLHEMLVAGNAVVLEYVMIPSCSPCITAGNGIKSLVSGYDNTHPGRVKVLQIGYIDSYTCDALKSWKNNNNFTFPILANGSAEVNYYGGMGMPTIVVAGGSDDKVYYKKQGYAPSDNNAIKSAIDNILSTTGINQLKQNGIKLFPIPFTDKLTIETDIMPITQVNLYDITGKVVLKQFNIFGSKVINTTELKQGSYFIELVLQNGKTITQKLIKQ